ncbi:MAG: peptide deformylase [Chloroflexota bacterium]
MAILPIRTLPDPVLRQKARKVTSIDRSVQRLINDMLETMHDAPGRVGLAAPQVGVSLRVIVIGIPDEEDIVLINPEIVRTRGERVIDEGCLSLPGYFGEITRSETVTVKGRDRDGKEVRIRATDLLAQALEHEIDHLNGMIYIDRLEDESQLRKVEPVPEGESPEDEPDTE